MKVQLFITCLAEQFFPTTLENMVRLLEKLGVEPVFPEQQTCCGQPFYNTGFQSEAKKLATSWLRTFGKSDLPVISPSGSCVDMVRHHYPELFAEGTAEQKLAVQLAERTFEFTEFLVHHMKSIDVGAAYPHRVTYHASCHLLRGLGINDEPKQLLQAVKGLELVPLVEEETCCGFGGAFSVIFPEVSRSMMQNKINHIENAKVDAVVACDAGCLMNIAGGLRQAGSKVRAMHIIDILASQEPLT
jgi:L-lactate dehydrogenase complex protein LldE